MVSTPVVKWELASGTYLHFVVLPPKGKRVTPEEKSGKSHLPFPPKNKAREMLRCHITGDLPGCKQQLLREPEKAGRKARNQVKASRDYFIVESVIRWMPHGFIFETIQ